MQFTVVKFHYANKLSLKKKIRKNTITALATGSPLQFLYFYIFLYFVNIPSKDIVLQFVIKAEFLIFLTLSPGQLYLYQRINNDLIYRNNNKI